MDIFSLHRGSVPLLISLPHDGVEIPASLAATMTRTARRVPDTDWHVAQLYAFARELGASMLVPRFSRYVVDLNRSMDDTSLYPGQNTTGLCPLLQFSGDRIYESGHEPDRAAVSSRVDTYWRPYHQALREEIRRLLAMHGRVVLWEGHSIRSVVPFLFDGRLPDINIGTANGASCAPRVRARITGVLEAQVDYRFVVDGRFKGGYITRHYGDPINAVDAIQLELAQATYMDEETGIYDAESARGVQALIARLFEAALGEPIGA